MPNRETISALSRHFVAFYAQSYVRNGKFPALSAIWKMPWRLLLMSARKVREMIGMFLFEEGKKFELLAKIFTLEIERKK